MQTTSDGGTSSSRCDSLVAEARKLALDGKMREAFRALQEASKLESNNPAIRNALQDFASPDDELVSLCQSLTLHDEASDQDFSRALIASIGCHTEQEASRAFDVLLNADHKHNLVYRDKIAASLLSQLTGQKALSKMMTTSLTGTFDRLWHLGGETMQGLTKTCLTPAVWTSEGDRLKCVKDTFALCLAMLLEPNARLEPESSMRSIAGLMTFHATDLISLIDTDNLAIILSFLNVAKSVQLRSQATLVTAKFLEAAKDRGQSMLKAYITSHVAKRANDDLVAGFSVAGAMFPITPDVGSSLFLTPGFIDDLVRVVQKTTSSSLCHSALDLLSAACIDKDCRAAIRASCASWLQDVLRDRPSQGNAALAALVMSKISQESGELELAHTTILFKEIIMASANAETELQTAFEGLAYCSTNPKVKEELAQDTSLLNCIIKKLSDPSYQGPLVFGGLTIFLNMTTYPPEMSIEQKRMDQLKAYANQSKPAEPNPLSNISHATSRAKKVIDVGIVALLLKSAKTATPTLLNLIASIILNLTRERRHCGLTIQQGILDILLPVTSYEGADTILLHARRNASQALARTIIPIDPMLVFTNQSTPKARSVATAIKAMTLLLNDRDAQDPRPAFEALQALTNLASMGEEVSEFITSFSFPFIESYLSSSLSAQQQASVELFSNLTVFDACCAMFAVQEPSKPKFPINYDGTTDFNHLPESRFLHLRALTEDNVRGVRLAAMAAIFNITERSSGTQMILNAASGLERLLPCLEATQPPESDNADHDMRARAAGTILNILHNGGIPAASRLKRLGAEQKLRTAKDEDVSGIVIGFATEALELIMVA